MASEFEKKDCLPRQSFFFYGTDLIGVLYGRPLSGVISSFSQCYQESNSEYYR